MLKKKIHQEVEKRENMRGGTGKVTIRHYLKPEEIQARTRLCAELILPPGASIGPHDHVDEDEIYIIQKGQGLMTDGGPPEKQDEAHPSSQGGKEFPVAAGDAILTGQGASHSIKNSGAEDLVITAVIIKY
jgi:mannose-6-phosphate isomerase-like protein (cupin superfamily)